MFDPGELLRICLLIQENLESDLSLMFLAQTTGLSRFRFHRVFKACVGETLHEYVIRQRMERAAFELRYPLPSSPRRSVKAIAYASGYKSLSSFSHAFFNYSALSPREFRFRSLNHRVALGAAAGTYIEPATAQILCRHARTRLPWSDVARRPRMAAHRFFAAGLSVSIERLAPRRFQVLSAAGASSWAERRDTAGAYGGNIALLVDSLPGLYARLARGRRGRAPGMGRRAPPLGCFCVETGDNSESTPMLMRQIPVQFSGGRHLVLEGMISLRKLYRCLLRDFDLWLLETGECPRVERLLVRFPGGVPAGLDTPAQLLLYLPLEEVPVLIDGDSTRKLRRVLPRGGSSQI